MQKKPAVLQAAAALLNTHHLMTLASNQPSMHEKRGVDIIDVNVQFAKHQNSYVKLQTHATLFCNTVKSVKATSYTTLVRKYAEI